MALIQLSKFDWWEVYCHFLRVYITQQKRYGKYLPLSPHQLQTDFYQKR